MFPLPEFVVRLRLSRLLNGIAAGIGRTAGRLIPDRRGNIALTFGIVSVPLLLGVGVSIDYVRAYNVRTKMQTDLDAALIAAVKKVDSLNEDQIKAEVGKWFDAQSQDHQANYRLLLDTMQINKSNRTIQAVATGAVPTTFLGLANIRNVNVSVVTSVSGPSTSYLNVYVVLDKSASMMLAATASGQQMMKTYAENSCVFACHTAEGDSNPYNGRVYTTNFALARAMNIKLRTDVAISATSQVLSMVSASDPTQSRIKVGLYAIGTDATEVLPPTTSISAAQTTLGDDSKGLTSATSQGASYFDVSLPALAKYVGTAGNGSSPTSPLKLVLILTDGVQSYRPWVMDGNGANNKVTPLNPAWCGAMKTAGATVGVLYTEYLPMPWDAGYKRTVGDKMKNSDFTTTWGGVIDKDADQNTSRLDYIPFSLRSCATSSDMYLSAASSTAIESGLATLFQQYLGSVRLTQ